MYIYNYLSNCKARLPFFLYIWIEITAKVDKQISPLGYIFGWGGTGKNLHLGGLNKKIIY